MSFSFATFAWGGRPLSRTGVFNRLVMLCAPVGVAAAEVVARLMGLSMSPLRILSPYQTLPSATVFVLLSTLATVRPVEVRLVLLVGSFLEAARLALFAAQGRNVLDSWSTFGMGLWYGSIVVAILRILRSPNEKRGEEIDRLLLRLALPLGGALSLFGLWWTVQAAPETFDNFFYAFDGLLGMPIASFLASLCQRMPSLWITAKVGYESIWFVMAAVVFVLCRTNAEAAIAFTGRWLLIGLVGWLLYFVLPGIGPDEAFWRHYGDALPPPGTVELIRTATDSIGPRNAMPSLHIAWALLLALEMRRLGRAWAVFGVAFVAVTVFATLGLKEHYVIDLIVAVPSTLTIYLLPGLFERDPRRGERLAAILAGGLLTIVLFCTIRFGTGALRTAPWIALSLSVAAVLAPLGSYLLLTRKERREQGSVRT